MTSSRTLLALAVAKQAAFWSRTLRRGGGEALPGLLAERISPSILSELASYLRHGCVVVTGTNGKTTTCLALALILEQEGYTVLRNKGGSNLTRGLVSALAENTPLLQGQPQHDIGLFEVDEATMPAAVPQLCPRVVLVTNIFRDQLDRYGEIDTTAALIGKALESTPSAIIVLNADDPTVAALGRNRPHVRYFGIDDPRLRARTELAIDAPDCPVCGSPLRFQPRHFSHIGHYYCTGCDFARPEPHVRGRRIELRADGTSFELECDGVLYQVTCPLTGLYNVYNMVAAAAVATALGLPAAQVVLAISRMRPAFGRLEQFSYEGRNGIIHLVKNPTGFNQVIENVCLFSGGKAALLCLNDNFADGTDISWIWDVDFSPLPAAFRQFVVSGTRAPELALRLKYAGASSERVTTQPDITPAFEHAIALVEKGSTLHIMTTYTAMLELRAYLVRKGVLHDYWQ